MYNLFITNIYIIFALENKCFTLLSADEISDNTPSRLAAMQHTWGVFSF